MTAKIFSIFFLAIILSEGLGLPFGRIISYYLIILYGASFFVYLIIVRKKITIPKTATLIYLIFLISSAISTLISTNFQQSIIGFLISLFLLLTLIVSYQSSQIISAIIPRIILVSAVLFILYSAALHILVLNYPVLRPIHGYQFVYSVFGSHNHLGDFLAIAETVVFYKLITTKKKYYLLIFLIFLYFLITSYSRTAYSALAITLLFQTFYFLKTKTISPKYLLLPVITIMLLFLSFFAIVQESKSFPFFRDVNQILNSQNILRPKYLVANRPFYFQSAFLTFLKNPFFGVGPNNLSIIYRQDPSKINWTYTSHNIFLDILAERGIFAFSIFLALILVACYLSLRKVSLNSFLFMSLLLMFQTDYLYLFYSVIFLFTILIGVILRDSQNG